MILTIRPATLDDARWIGANLREEDEREVQTASRQTGMSAVLAAAQLRESYTLRLATPQGSVEEHPAIIFGLSPLNPGHAAIWMLGTPDITRAPLSILREAQHWVSHWSKQYAMLENLADERNSLHIRWIQLLGFSLGETYWLNGAPFRHFYRSNPHV